jgi:integrase
MSKRHRNGGIRKLCEHSRRTWSDCSHPWHFSFKWKDTHYRFSLDKHLGRRIDSKSAAETEAERLRIAIREGTFGKSAPVVESLTMSQLLDLYDKQYLQTERVASANNLKYQLPKITALSLSCPMGGEKAFGDWLVADVTTEVIDQFKLRRSAAGVIAANRDLSLLSACFHWATSKRRNLAAHNPFLDGVKSAIEHTKEHARSRRLHAGEGAELLAACGDHLRAVVEAALETGMRRGEILSLQWKQVEGLTIDKKTISWAAQATLFLPHQKTKTKTVRRIPISTRLKAILEMRRFNPVNKPHSADAYVFGTVTGEQIASIDRAWYRAVLRSHGHSPSYVAGLNLSPASREALRAIDLHFHDLRREAGSRWMDGGVPIATIQRWLGHSNVSQTSTYLAGASTSEQDAMSRYEAQQAALQPIATDAGKRGKRRARTTTTRDRKLNKTAVRDNPSIM